MGGPQVQIGGKEAKKFRLVKIRYLDHVEFRNMSFSKIKPIIRETVGWLVYEDDDYVIVVWDRPALKGFAVKPRESGLLILKSDIIEVETIEVKPS